MKAFFIKIGQAIKAFFIKLGKILLPALTLGLSELIKYVRRKWKETK